ncbi:MULTISPECIES: enoyl-CoA hydratase/isomerase family protein [unclassified Microbacterium]|uniref:enoyl-CoA hydratase/isomerase family protein n=1 Tax=unclassified Microbacterium TaxID=2609290 RepID=UPI0012FA1AF7|nr:enoyl-CoA hydratase-related protein [Microbacterium sp. MAH-37]MVQ42240.1 enoyl-CoA hydratase [Microbacterium sp. MAH-37]
MTDQVLLDRDGAVAIITLDRPEGRNALNVALKTALVAATAEVAADETVRAVVLAADGPAFSVGQDLAEHAALLADGGGAAAISTVRDHYSPVVRSLMTMPKPVIAAVDGACVGAGLGLALASDLRVFGPGAKLGTAFTGIGLTFDTGLSYTLPRAVGEARARELILLPRMFGPQEAVAWGITGEIAEDPRARAREIAGLLAQGPTAAYRESKRLLLDAAALEAALEAEAVSQARAGDTQDHRDAVEAFLARRAPVFTGK